MSYINKEDLLATINDVWERKYERCNYKLVYDFYRMVFHRIHRASTIEIVRCSDCKHCEEYDEFEGYHCAFHERPTRLDDFFNYGKRSK